MRNTAEPNQSGPSEALDDHLLLSLVVKDLARESVGESKVAGLKDPSPS
jgi:hypothetical protein